MNCDDAYARREIDEKFKNIDTKLDLIHDQVKQTNGRVTSLEKWRYATFGGLSVITMVVLPILYWMLQQWGG